MTRGILLLIFLLSFADAIFGQHSVARQWNEQVLNAIRADFARPTVHARNLYHTSFAMYDAWAIYEGTAETYFLGKTLHGYPCPIDPIHQPANIREAQETAISYAVYRLIKHRFQSSPRVETLFAEVDAFMTSLGYDINFTSTDYTCSPAAMGNFIAEQIIIYGREDGSNETWDYGNLFYEPVNAPMPIFIPGNSSLTDFNRWQPLQLSLFIDQGGTTIPDNTPEFLSPEWGAVHPFALKDEDAVSYERDGFNYKVYHDPGPPPYLDTVNPDELSDNYQWGHSLVAIWSSHLDPNDGVMWDISPASIGNLSSYPESFLDYPDFYNTFEGGDPSPGHDVNPKTGQPYEPQIVPRADYARVLAEFWADGPDSETPPGHWFTILNYVSDHPELEKKIGGTGPVLSDLEWDVKSYFILGGAMHDAAITAWGIKGWYDYIRPVSAIRGMAELGQSSDPFLSTYHPGGLPLIPGFIETIEDGEPLAGPINEFAKQIKIKAWRGPDFIPNPFVTFAGVDWIRAAEWYPYQRPSFVTPPFAGYVSGHSTYSRAAAEVLTALTGDPFFPGGMGEFFCPRNEFLVFEDGPSVDVTLQWATYRDASDQCSLSRIWGGIHPPCDDIPGRLIGIKIGMDAFEYALQYFEKESEPVTLTGASLFPNPAICYVNIEYENDGQIPVRLFKADGAMILEGLLDINENRGQLYLGHLPDGVYVLAGYDENDKRIISEKIVIQNP